MAGAPDASRRPPSRDAACVGVCSWSLRPTSPEDLAQKAYAAGVEGVQLALDPLRRGDWHAETTSSCLEQAGLALRSGMMSMRGEDYTSLESIRRTGGLRPTMTWADNLAAADAAAALASRLGIGLVSFHAGFLPHAPRDPERGTLLARLRAVVDRFAEQGVAVALETGQEAAETLLGVLADLDRATVGVNFDPANMILYDMGDPVEALDALAPHVRQVHVKDARRTTESGTWGEEVPVGQGEVDWPAFFDVLNARRLAVDLMIEREAGEDRVRDVRTARELVTRLAGAARS